MIPPVPNDAKAFDMDLAPKELRRTISMLRAQGEAENDRASTAEEAQQMREARMHIRRADAYFVAARRWEAVLAGIEGRLREGDPWEAAPLH
jgi:hypothetical protein